MGTIPVRILDGPHRGDHDAELPSGVEAGEGWTLSHLFVLDGVVSAVLSGGSPPEGVTAEESVTLDARTWVYEVSGDGAVDGAPTFTLVQPGASG